MEKEIENLFSQWNIKDDVKDILRKEKLIVKQVNGKPALINPNIDLKTPFENWQGNAKDIIKKEFESGKFFDCIWEPKENYAIDKTSNNEELMKNGYAPYDENGCKYELHKIANDPNAPIAELHKNTHRCNGILHRDTLLIEKKERENYWKNR